MEMYTIQKTPALTDGGIFFGIVAMLITACE